MRRRNRKANFRFAFAIRAMCDACGTHCYVKNLLSSRFFTLISIPQALCDRSGCLCACPSHFTPFCLPSKLKTPGRALPGVFGLLFRHRPGSSVADRSARIRPPGRRLNCIFSMQTSYSCPQAFLNSFQISLYLSSASAETFCTISPAAASSGSTIRSFISSEMYSSAALLVQ